MNYLNKIKNKINMENALLVFIVISPLLDIMSFFFREKYTTYISPTAIIRILILMFVFLNIFFTKKIKKEMFLISILYLLYNIVHLLMFKNFQQGISYGTITQELRYLINYTFGIIILFNFLIIFYKKDLNKLKTYILISLAIYISSIYLSILTKTYTNTYIEGTGIKGWFISGNSLGGILLLGIFLLYAIVPNSKYKKLIWLTIVSIGIFLILLLGTRVGMFGFLIATFIFFISKLIYNIKNKIHFSKKYIILFSTLFIIAIIVLITFTSHTLNRQKYLQTINANIIDKNTNNQINVTIDTAHLVNDIQNKKYDNKYISKASSDAFLQLYEFANKHNINSTNRRVQQLIFNLYLVRNQKNIMGILFGNGLLNNFAELVLEMEIPALILNFGIIGFILFFMPFLFMLFYSIYMGFRYISKIDIEYIMLIFGDLCAFALAFFTGVTFFSISSITIIVCINLILLNKLSTWKERGNTNEKNTFWNN